MAGDRLIGVIIVGVGLPQLCLERDLIRSYFADRDRDGFAYAYRFPGFNKVLQAAGRVIRSGTDRGVVVLIDSRFQWPGYRDLFPGEWQHYETVEDLQQLQAGLKSFWAEKEQPDGAGPGSINNLGTICE